VARLRGSFETLSASHRTVLELFYLRSLSVRSIADRLGISPGTVKSRLFHARKILRETLED
jgi:RNA polymerase sigma-70 factor (ECF subfamily)